MSASKGWPAEVVIEGALVDEEMQGSPAIAAQKIFYSRSFPIVDPSTKVVTDDETKVTVTVDGTPEASGNYTLTGATGKIEFTTAPGAGKEVTLGYTYKWTLAYGRSIDATVDGGLEGLYVLGMRTPKEILEGAVKITGKLSRYFVSRDWIGKVVPDPGGDYGDEGQQAFSLYLYPLGNSSGKPYFLIGGVKFGPWSIAVPDMNTPITEDLDWMGISITPGTV